MTFKEFMKQPNPHLDKLSEEAEAKRTADEEFAYEARINVTEIIDAFLSVSERELENYVYHVFKTKGQRDAVRVCKKIFRLDNMRATQVLRCIVQEHMKMEA